VNAQRPAFAQAQALGLAHGAATVFQGLNFTLYGGLTLVRGGEGRGKSTLLRLLAGQAVPTAGAVHQPAQPAFLHDARAPALDALVARAWLQQLRPLYPAWCEAQVPAEVEAFGLAPHLDKPMHMLSNGSRRKVALLAAVVSGAPLTLLDSPYAALDTPSCQWLNQHLRRAAQATDRAWVLADYEAPAALADVQWAGVVDLGD
jgi:ABC-type transport system involved in cytochrome c biogenesis ATPase subunit